MRRIHLLLSVLTVFIMAVSLTGSVTAAAPAQAKWTVMVYISGDNDLESYVISDIETELGAVGSTADVQVVALADRGPDASTGPGDWKQTLLFHVRKGMKADPSDSALVADWGERDMADPQNLVEFIQWAKSTYPAEHYALYFWGHGWNWRPGYVMRDDTDKDTMDMQELQAALPSIGFIDMVGFDGCNMAAIEVETLWHGHATALTHSEEYVVWEGVQYDLVLKEMTAHPAMTADDVAIATAKTATEDKTWSAVAVDNRFDALLTAVDRWSAALQGGLATHRQKYDRAFGATKSFWQAPEDKDLYDMAYEINRLVPDTNIQRKSQAVMKAVSAVVLYERHARSYNGVHGISIYQISKASQKDDKYEYYRSLVDFAQQTGWDEFLDAYAIK